MAVSVDADSQAATHPVLPGERTTAVNISTLDLNLLLVLDALQRTHSTTLAGEQLCISQSGVSNALRRLRDAFGDELFVRTKSGMMPTPLAESMAAPIRDALQQIHQTIANRGCFDAAQSTQHFRLALSDVGQMSLLPHLLSYFDKHAPNISLETVPLSRKGVAEQMSAGEIDLAIGVARPLGAGFFRRRFRSLRFVCLVSKKHPTIQGSITLDQFLRASFVEYEPTGGSYGRFRKHADPIFEENSIQRKVSVKLTYLSGIEPIIASSDRIAVVTEALVTCMDLENTVQVISLPFDIPAIGVTLQWHPRIHKDPAQMWLHKAVIDVAESLDRYSITHADTGNSELSLALA